MTLTIRRATVASCFKMMPIKEVSILTQNSDQHSDSKVEFLDVQGNKLNIPGTNQTSQVINKSDNSRPTLIHRVIVPEGATEMRIFNNSYNDSVMNVLETTF